jgi:hypothetical protein
MVEAKTFIQFRVEGPVYQQLQKFAELLHSGGAIVKPTVSALAKFCHHIFGHLKHHMFGKGHMSPNMGSQIHAPAY